MEINDVREIEIVHTIERIMGINEAIIFHQKFDEPDYFTIRQWQKVKLDLQGQLRELLAAIDALPQLIKTTKNRGMAPEHMSKIRDARMARHAEAVAAGTGTPQIKTIKKSKDDATVQKSGRSPEHINKIREARMAANRTKDNTARTKT